jgi:eukaryotic-like serine/threonine-protein kinase
LDKLKQGYIIDGQYMIMSFIAQGGMADVYRAERLSDHKIIAVKIPFQHLSDKLSSSQRFKRSENIRKLIDHPNIVQVYVHDGQKSFPYLLMEYVNGPALDKIIKFKKQLPLSQITRIAIQVCDALEYIHQHKVIHHDIKPGNIMLTKEDDVKILDFGLAYAEDFKDDVWADQISVGGTPVYMAPEQLQGINDTRSDLYSLGVVMYEMATGKVPFRGDVKELKNAHLTQAPPRPRFFNPQIPVALENIILKAMVKDPSQRYQNAFEMRRDILNVMYGKKTEQDYHYQKLILLLMLVIIFVIFLLINLAKLIHG